jgi:hypothetical protein
LMSQIYRKAHSVLVWLGEENHNSGFILQALRAISTCKDTEARATYLADRAVLWQALVHLTRRKYWTRMWIVQEITVARSIEVFCGSQMIPWSVFATACKFPPDQLTIWASEFWGPLNRGDDDVKL